MTIDARGGPAQTPRARPRGAAKSFGETASSVGAALGVVFVAALVVCLIRGETAPPVVAALAPTNADAEPTKATIADQVLADPEKFMTLQRAGRDQLAAILKDPDSAEYRDIVAVSPPRSKGNVAFCGLVNAKGGFGSYTGYTRFISVPDVGAWVRNSPGVRFKEVWRDFCQDRFVISKAEFVN